MCSVKCVFNVLVMSYFLAATFSRTKATRRRKREKKEKKKCLKATHLYVSIFYLKNSKKK